jgi:hypothetical protein
VVYMKLSPQSVKWKCRKSSSVFFNSMICVCQRKHE